MPTDRETLDSIEGLFSEKLETPFGEEYDSLIESLSFTCTPLDDLESGELKRLNRSFIIRCTRQTEAGWMDFLAKDGVRGVEGLVGSGRFSRWLRKLVVTA
jgi:hypothetical protein